MLPVRSLTLRSLSRFLDERDQRVVVEVGPLEVRRVARAGDLDDRRVGEALRAVDDKVRRKLHVVGTCDHQDRNAGGVEVFVRDRVADQGGADRAIGGVWKVFSSW